MHVNVFPKRKRVQLEDLPSSALSPLSEKGHNLVLRSRSLEVILQRRGHNLLPRLESPAGTDVYIPLIFVKLSVLSSCCSFTLILSFGFVSHREGGAARSIHGVVAGFGMFC